VLRLFFFEHFLELQSPYTLTLLSEIWEVARPVVAGAKAAVEAKREARIVNFILSELIDYLFLIL